MVVIQKTTNTGKQTTIEIIIEVPQKIKNKWTVWLPVGIGPKDSTHHRDDCTQILTVAVFTITSLGTILMSNKNKTHFKVVYNAVIWIRMAVMYLNA